MKGKSYTSTPPMSRTACTEPQCLYKGDLYLYLLHRNLVGVRTVDVAFFWKHVLSASSTDLTGHKEECTLQTVTVFMPYFVFSPTPHVSQLQLRHIHLLLHAESVGDLQLPAP